MVRTRLPDEKSNKQQEESKRAFDQNRLHDTPHPGSGFKCGSAIQATIPNT
jgi:hypothetical protein